MQYIYRYLQAVCQVGSLDSTLTERWKTVAERFEIAQTGPEQALVGKDKYKALMRKWLPLGEALMYATVVHLPSPTEAQKYRVNMLFDGPHEHPGYVAIRDCDPTGPLMIYVSKMIPTGEGGRFYAFGRVFSGTIVAGQKVTVLGANYVPGGTEDITVGKSVTRVIALVASRTETVSEMGAGNTVALMGLDSVLLKSGTVTTLADPYPIRTMRLSVSPVVRVSVRPKNGADLPKLAEAVARLSKTDPCIQCSSGNDGTFVIAAAGELHMEICLGDLRGFLNGEIIVGKPVVPFQETISTTSAVCLAKSPNKHNRIFANAEPLPEDLVVDLESGKLPKKDFVALAKILNERYGWNVDPKRIWALGPEVCPTNILIDCTKAVAYLTEAKDLIVSAFLQLTAAGVLAGETVRGVRFNVHDVVLHADNVHRGQGEVIPAAKRAFSASILGGSPLLVEPIFQTDIQVPDTCVSTVYSCIAYRRGKVSEEIRVEGTPLVTVRAHLPVLESFGFDAYMRSNTSGRAFTQMVFDHWEPMSGLALDDESPARKCIREIRARKGGEADIPPFERFVDKL